MPGPTPKPLTPRKIKLRRTIVFLSLLLVLGMGVLYVTYWRTRPVPYRPGEANADVTSQLSQALPPGAPMPRFVDVTEAAGLGDFRNFAGDRTSQIPEDMGPGLAWGDYDNDGDEDLFLVSAGGSFAMPSESWPACGLYQNQGDGTFVRVGSFPETRLGGMAAAWGDYDDDGWLDLIVTGFQAMRLFHNDQGTGHFTLSPTFPNHPGYWAGATWGDFDNDRDLDLYVCGYVNYQTNAAIQGKSSQQLGTAVPYTLNPASYDPGSNLLFRNDGGGAFVEVAESMGVSNPQGRSLGALWHDFDQDGWLDLYVANDISDNAFYRNTGHGFEDISLPAWVADYRSAMGLAAGDWNRDGDDDLFITHWVAQENALYDNLHSDMTSTGNGPNNQTVEGNSPPSNQSALRFVDVNEMQGLGQVALPYVGWGTEFVDVDSDGWLDLMVANGNTIEEGGNPKRLKPQEPFLFWNRQGNYFHNLAPLCEPFTEKHVSRGLAIADYDQDGDMDIVVAQLGEGVQLLRNDTTAGHWLKVRLRSLNGQGQPTGRGDGTTVIAHGNGVEWRRAVSSVSYLSQSSRELHFGLGTNRTVSVLEVRWHAGETNRYLDLPVDSVWEITEGVMVPRQVTSPLSVAVDSSLDEKARIVEFWKHHRAAMQVMKVEGDEARAIPLFREALRMDPRHEDAHYYLAQCLAMEGEVTEALVVLDKLAKINPQSHRAFQQWGRLRALNATSKEHLAESASYLEKARALNPEETGALLLLGEIALLQGDLDRAMSRLEDVCRSNPRAVGGYFLRSYVAWKRGEQERSIQWLKETRRALGPEWQPHGTTAEGDVKQKWHTEDTPCSEFWEAWDGLMDPDQTHDLLDTFLQERNFRN